MYVTAFITQNIPDLNKTAPSTFLNFLLQMNLQLAIHSVCKFVPYIACYQPTTILFPAVFTSILWSSVRIKSLETDLQLRFFDVLELEPCQYIPDIFKLSYGY
jgi:hypothetical protein